MPKKEIVIELQQQTEVCKIHLKVIEKLLTELFSSRYQF